MVLPLAVSDELARIKLVSEPLGAQVYQNGQLLAGVQTPAEVLVEAGKLQRFTLTMPGYVPAFIDPFTPDAVRSASSRPASSCPASPCASNRARGQSQHPRRTALQGSAPPAECTLAAGTYTVELTTPPTKATHQVVVGNKALTERFELGLVEAGDGKQLMIGGKNVKKALSKQGRA